MKPSFLASARFTVGVLHVGYQPGRHTGGLAAGEAVLRLLIEITFIATFTQRFFAR